MTLKILLNLFYFSLVLLVGFFMASHLPDAWFMLFGSNVGADPAWSKALFWNEILTPLSYVIWLLAAAVYALLYRFKKLPGL